MADVQQQEATTTTPAPQGRKNEKIGEVVSTKMTKTIVVVVTRRVPHPMYKRIVTKKKKFYAHDEEESAKTGDIVRIVEHKPMSKLKRWILGDVVRRAVQVNVDVAAVETPGSAGKPRTTKKKKK
ncbi:MAG: 30S ribosomal protein S17 [Bryobacteraceae bacterium]|nr:30S ribosomal protein S17 [Bryobacteraceae bacterium]